MISPRIAWKYRKLAWRYRALWKYRSIWQHRKDVMAALLTGAVVGWAAAHDSRINPSN